MQTVDVSELDGSVSYWAKLRHDGLYDFGITVCDLADRKRDRSFKCGIAADSREATNQAHAARTGYLAAVSA
jgi:hypothetical protein